MLNVPVTYRFNFDCTNDVTRPYVMHEFAANEAKCLVLGEILLRMIMGNRTMAEKLEHEMAAEGLVFCDAHAVAGAYLDLNCPIAEARAEMLLRHKLQLQITASMGVKTIAIHTGNEKVYPEYPIETQYEYIKRSLEELLPLAEKLGIVICIENTWFQLSTAERMLGLMQDFSCESLGFCYDSGHANLMDKGRNSPDSAAYRAWGDVPPQFEDKLLEKLLPNVVNCHLHDNDGISDQHLNIGRGNIDWMQINSLLKQAPRLQVVQSEVNQIMAHDSIRDICEKFRWFQQL